MRNTDDNNNGHNMSQDTVKTAINIAVVGHTNAGKTSLIRTLLRDDRFGQVDDAAGTTRYVEKTTIFADDREVLNLFDTPGFEDSSALLQELDDLSDSIQTSMPVELLKAFIKQCDDYPDFEQEIKVLRQAINSDVLLYLIDVREPLLGKYIDEIEILSKAGLPILPVFNFIAGNGDALAQWRKQLTQFNLHSALEFDTVAFDFNAEKRLYQKLQSLLEQHYEELQTLIDYRQEVWNNLAHAAAQRIFLLLTEVACYRLEVGGNGNSSGSTSQIDNNTMQAFVRTAEKQALQDLLAIFAFKRLDVELQQLAVRNGEWELDIFSPQMLKSFGLNAGATALKGAAAGAGIDLMVGGLSLGAATALGAAIGAGWATVRRYQQELQAAIRGHKWLCVDDNTVSLLYLRQQRLLHTLTHRGHAAQDRLSFTNDGDRLLPEQSSTKPSLAKPSLPKPSLPKPSLPKQWSKAIKTLRQNPEWQHTPTSDVDYKMLQDLVIGWLLKEEES